MGRHSIWDYTFGLLLMAGLICALPSCQSAGQRVSQSGGEASAANGTGGLIGAVSTTYAAGDPWTDRITSGAVGVSSLAGIIGLRKVIDKMRQKKPPPTPEAQTVKFLQTEMSELFKVGTTALQRLIETSERQTEIQRNQMALMVTMHNDVKIILGMLTNASPSRKTEDRPI